MLVSVRCLSSNGASVGKNTAWAMLTYSFLVCHYRKKTVCQIGTLTPPVADVYESLCGNDDGSSYTGSRKTAIHRSLENSHEKALAVIVRCPPHRLFQRPARRRGQRSGHGRPAGQLLD